jgi:hypothetical protein
LRLDAVIAAEDLLADGGVEHAIRLREAADAQAAAQ